MLRNFLSVALFTLALVFAPASTWAAADPTPFSSREPTLNKNTQELLDEAQRSAKAGKLDDARRALDLAASLEPRNPFVIARLAVVLNKAGNYELALDRLRALRARGVFDEVMLGPMLDAMLSMGQDQEVLDLFSDPGPDKRTYAAGIVLRARASALQVLGNSAAATAAMNRSLAILNDYDGIMTAGRIDLLQGNFDAADAQADAALNLKRGDIDARILKIDLAMQRRNVKAAQQMSDLLVADNPESLLSLLTRIKVYLSIDRADKAEPDVDRILAATPTMPIALYFKAVILARHGDIKGAWNTAHSLPTEFTRDDPDFALNVADMAVAAGFPDSGVSILSAAVLHFPYQLELRLRLADVRLRQNNPDNALQELAPVQDSRDPRVLVLFARAALQKKDRVGAQAYIERALDAGGGEQLRTLDKDTALTSMSSYLTRHPGNKLVKKQYAILLLGFGQTEKARSAYEQLVRADPTDAVALNNLSWLVVHDDPGRALVLAERAVKAQPASANFLDTLGSMQMNRSDYKGAVASLQRAREISPDNAEIAYHLALAFEAAGDKAQVQALVRQFMKRGSFSDWDAAKGLRASRLP